MKEGIIGVIYRHGYNDYEFMLGNFPSKMRERVEQEVALFDDGYNLAGCRGNRKMTLEDANIDHFERTTWDNKYASTADPEDIVTLPQIFERYYQINGNCDGFEKYVMDGFVDEAGFREYVEVDE